jgi:pimeloyl-ACP methyl ester carboxylesterase
MPNQTRGNEAVLLIPGLWMGGNIMRVFAYQLRVAGFTTENFSYRMLRQGLEANCRRLQRRINSSSHERIHLVGHSLGGVLALQTLARYPEAISGRVVCLGSPLLNTMAGRRLATSRIGSRMLGRTLPEAVFEHPLESWRGVQDVGVVAGSVGLGLGMIVTPRLRRPHDGVVEVAETCLPGITDHLELRVNHTGLLLSREAATQTAHFLHHGRFQRA